MRTSRVLKLCRALEWGYMRWAGYETRQNEARVERRGHTTATLKRLVLGVSGVCEFATRITQ
jgi:hypothetical protein